MDAGRFDALARALTSGATRRRLLQTLPGLAVGGVLPWPSVARALDAGNDPVTPPAGDARACTGGADCATGEICLNGFCRAAAGATATGDDAAIACPTALPSGTAAAQSPTPAGGAATGQDSAATATAVPGQAPAGQTPATSGQDPTAIPAAGGAPPTATPRAVGDGANSGGAAAPTSTPRADAASGETPTAASDAAAPTPTAVGDNAESGGAGGATAPTSTPAPESDDQGDSPPEPTPRSVTTPAGEGGQTSTPVAIATVVVEIPPDQPLAAQIHEGVCRSLGDTAEFPLIPVGVGLGNGATPVADGELLGAASAITARLSTTIVDSTLADLLADPFAIDIRVTADDPETSIACGEIGALAIPSGSNPQVAIGLATRNGSGFAGIASLLEQNGRTVVSIFVAPGLGGGTTAGFAAADPTDRVPVPVPAAPPLAAGATATLTEAVVLRSAPRDDSAVVAELDAGAGVTVIAAPVDGWVSVREEEGDRPGYVEVGSLTSGE